MSTSKYWLSFLDFNEFPFISYLDRHIEMIMEELATLLVREVFRPMSGECHEPLRVEFNVKETLDERVLGHFKPEKKYLEHMKRGLEKLLHSRI